MGVLDSCTPTRFLSKSQALVSKVKINGLPYEIKAKAFTYLRQKPNRKFLLAIFNTFNTRHGKYKDSLKIKHNLGEEPVIYDSALTRQSNEQIKGFLKNRGYFDAIVKDSTIIKKRRAYITFSIRLNAPYYIENISDSIPDSSLKSIYKKYLEQSKLKAGLIYDTDLMEAEQSRVNENYRNLGYYRFTKKFVRFIVYDTLRTHKVHIKLIVENPDSGEHQKYYIDSVVVEIHTALGNLDKHKVYKDTLKFKNNLFYFDPYHRYNPRILNNSIYLKYGSIFQNSDQSLTYRRLAQLGVFRLIRIDFEEFKQNSKNWLNTKIDLTESKKYGISLSGEGTLNQDFYGLNSSLTFSDHNFLKGAELFEFKVGGTYNNNLPSRTNIYNRTEFTTQASLQFPFLLIPFYSPTMGKDGDIPHTKIIAGYSYVQQPSFNQREYSTSLNYQFLDTKAKIHTITPIELSLINAFLDPRIKAQFDSTGNQSRLQSFTSSIIAGSAYNYEENGYLLRSHRDFIYFNGRLEAVGNSLSLIDRYISKKSARGNGEILGQPYYRFIKPEIDLRWYKNINGQSQLIFRIAPGIAYAYGNTDFLKSVPYDRQFFVGGPNSIRAWSTRQLGPGAYLRPIPLSTTPHQDTLAILASELRGLDQTGEVKIEGNIEYRFLISPDVFGRSLYGASFADFGNIWLLRPDPTRPNANITASNFFKQIAIGIGSGLRYDFGFFIFRFDLGLKIYDPVFSATDGWVIKYFNSSVFKQNYSNTYGGVLSNHQFINNNSSFGYHFLNYNFGIGFPF